MVIFKESHSFRISSICFCFQNFTINWFFSFQFSWSCLLISRGFFFFLQACLISFHRLHQSPKPTNQVSNKEESNSIYQSICGCMHSSEVPSQTCNLTRNRSPSQVIVPQGLLPSPAVHSSSFTSFRHDNPTLKFLNFSVLDFRSLKTLLGYHSCL